MQFVEVGHAIAFSVALIALAVGAGIGIVDQLVPFQRSARGDAPEAVIIPPTAMQLALLVQDTPNRLLCELAVGFGAIDQLVPFQLSMSVNDPSAPLAKHRLVDAHAMPVRKVPLPLDPGLATTDQPVPFHRSTSALNVLPVTLFPTAKQLVAPEHETPPSTLPRAPATFGLATIDQDDPFQRSISVFCTRPSLVCPVVAQPVAKQLVELTQEIPLKVLSVAPAKFGVGTIVQLDPFHRSANVDVVKFGFTYFCVLPTARQFDALVQETLERLTPSTPLGFGLALICQLDPFQRSMSVELAEPIATLLRDIPTAKQLVVLEHETPPSPDDTAPPGIGTGTIDHAVPFHRSKSAVLSDPPTAKQFAALVHATFARKLSIEPEGSGTDSTDQAVPFHRSAKGRASPPVVYVYPTAKHCVVEGHDIPPRLPTGGPGGLGLATIDHAGVTLPAGAASIARLATSARTT
jgi:hypothetical protein